MQNNINGKLLETKLALINRINECLTTPQGGNPDVLLTLTQALAILEEGMVDSGHCHCE